MNGYGGFYPATAYGGGMGYGGGYPYQPVSAAGSMPGFLPGGQGAIPGYQAPLAGALTGPRTSTMTVVARVSETGAVQVIDQYRGRPYLSPQDMRSFNKVKRLAKRLKRLFPSRRVCKKGRRR